MNSLPPAVAWLENGPESTKIAVISAKRKMLLFQGPIALGCIAIFATLRSLGIVEAKGHPQLITHFCAAAAFMWPPTLFSVCLAAQIDAKATTGSIKSQLRMLSLASGTVAGFATLALTGVAILYTWIVLRA